MTLALYSDSTLAPSFSLSSVRENVMVDVAESLEHPTLKETRRLEVTIEACRRRRRMGKSFTIDVRENGFIFLLVDRDIIAVVDRQ
eukprot:CAMPEP_0201963632 /NCGR_PEP_ID=MMETSP0904-20121228/9475_1 /ASSEMBLY_ACC=CAM_ASM_000553 /TAXON_ID=420261 /ORGANISM="Thalassiosira antarctica, Strain CCMP982" /LENGTH=85 /DNA_ID=CAMNT_0048510305 /DNA_START=92 /DNA_END=346 /DNA_ORIENTATION=+